MEFRFGIGSIEGPQSSTWKLWAYKDDIYLVQRSIFADKYKFSFHKSRNCRWAEINPNKNGEQRKMFEWQRDETPLAGTNSCCRLASLAFPTNHLSSAKTKKDSKVHWLSPAPANQATMIEIMLSNDNQEVIDAAFIASQRTRIFSMNMKNGEFLHVSSMFFDCGPVNMTSPTPKRIGSPFGCLRFPDNDETNSGRPVRMSLINQQTMPPCVWELGGYKAV